MMKTTPFRIWRYGHQLRAVLIGIFLCVLTGGGLLACSSGQSTPAAERLAQIQVTPTELSFGGMELGSSASLSVTVANMGSADLTLTSVSVENKEGGVFTLTAGAATSGVMLIAPGGSQEVSVTYQPASLGMATGVLWIGTELAATPEVTVDLAGNGLAVPTPQLRVQPSEVIFSSEVLVGQSERLTVTLSNTGNAELIIAAVSIESSDTGMFAVDHSPPLPMTIAPGLETTLDLVFEPTSSGSKSATLHVQSNVAGRTDTAIGLSGVSPPTPQMRVSPMTLSYGDVHIGQSQMADVMIANPGGAALMVSELTVEVAAPVTFHLGANAPSLPARVVPGDTLTLAVVFEPLLAGNLTGRLRLVGDAPDTPTATVELRGTGLRVPVVTLRLLSAPAHLISGGDALVQIEVDPETSLDQVEVSLNGADVTPLFRSVRRTMADANQILRGLLSGLAIGDHTLTLTVLDANQVPIQKAGSTLSLTNWPISGPLISGSRETPFICQTQSFNIGPDLGNLAAPVDDDCSVDTRVDFVYRSTDGQFKNLGDPAVRPADLEQVTTTSGERVPYIVRLETGTVNRAIYQTAVLATSPDGAPDPWQSAPGWNGRLVYKFGGGCRGGWYRQGDNLEEVLDHMMLSQGFATASASLNVFGNNCNTLLAAETMMMVKERFIKRNGTPQHTIGWGCSGGSYQAHFIADNYPGLLDGIVPQCSFPEVAFAATHTFSDAWLLETYFNRPDTVPWEGKAQLAVTGFGVLGHLSALSQAAERIDPVPNRPGRLSAEFNPVVPSDMHYNPKLNPTGARATIYDHTVAVYGRQAATGFARRPLDNVGIQYGLRALNDGTISTAQFLDLNERIGGFDIDANIVVDKRTVADLSAIRRAYLSGQLLSGGGGLASVPILDIDVLYTDRDTGGDIHMKFHHFSTRERLRLANGRSDNHVMWSGAGGDLARNLRQGLMLMDDWLTRIQADTSEVAAVDKAVQNKPSGLTDGCWTPGANPMFIAEPQEFGGMGTSDCNDLYPAFSSPRMVAGGPLVNDIVKCQLKPIKLTDYDVPFAQAEEDRLHQIFPDGVCDWDQPGVEQQPLRGVWLSFGPSPVNRIDPAE